MRACQNLAIYCETPGQERKKQMRAHRKRMKDIKGVLKPSDLKYEVTQTSRNNQDSSKISAMRYGHDAVIARNNLVLAKRIFEIMEGPGIISDLLESDPTTNHPGTINFPHRLAEAKRIHNENLIIASRLDSVQPTYYDKSGITSIRKGSPTKGKRPQSPRPPAQKHTKKQRQGQNGREGETDDATQHSVVEGSRSEDKPPKSKNVLLEYTKIQRGRVLDVAVIKEPFRDSYSIFGIDVDNGQRYELKLSSEEVSTALEGDLLVTSVDNVEVWMALISKVELNPVEAFSKTPLPNASHVHNSHSETKNPMKPTTLNSSKNQNNNNPRKNKFVKKDSGHTPASRDRVNTGVSSLGSSSAINGTDDDYSLTTAGGDISQRTNMDNDNDIDLNFDGGDGGGEGGDSTKGYTLDEYYEDHAPLSPLPSQTGFVTSAPSGKQRATNNNTGSPPSETSRGGSDTTEKYQDSNSGDSTPYSAAVAVKYIMDTAVKNVMLQQKAQSQQPASKKGVTGSHEKTRPSDKGAGQQSSPAKNTVPPPNPYTSTTVTVSARSNSIMYKPVVPPGGNKEKATTEGGDRSNAQGQQSRPPMTPERTKPSPSTPASKTKHKSKATNEMKEPQKPKEGAPTGSNRRPSQRQRQIVDTGNSKRKPSSMTGTDTIHHGNASSRKQSNAVHNSDDNKSNRKKSNAVNNEGRRVSTFRKPADPMVAVTTLAPKVADMATKTAIKRVKGIVELFDIELPEE